MLIASKPIHSTFARSHAEHAGSLPSHFCFRERQRVHDEIARATLYCGWSAAGSGDDWPDGDGFDSELDLREGGLGAEKVGTEVAWGYGEKWPESDGEWRAVGTFMVKVEPFWG